MKRFSGVCITALVCIVLGCSGGQATLTLPGEQVASDSPNAGSHMLWGLYQFYCDRNAGAIDVVPLRDSDVHLNALRVLEPPVGLYLTVENIMFSGDKIECDVGLRHPFLGLVQYTGFDVCGILISRGSIGGFTDPDLLLPGDADFRLLNADGYTRWWNPAEFPVNNGTMFGYTDGLLGTPQSVANFNATLNGYKYFCDELADPDDPIYNVDPARRGVFSAGQKNVRHYVIGVGDAGMIFNYAIDACWKFPTGNPPWEVPGDFPQAANRPEAWNISANIVENTLWNDGTNYGGDLNMAIDVYDWFSPELNLVAVDSPGNFNAIIDAAPSGGGVGYSTYAIDIHGATPSFAQIDILISAKCEMSGYAGLLPGKPQAAYKMITVQVDDEAPPQQDWPPEWMCFHYSADNIGMNMNNPDGFDPTNYTQVWYAPDEGTKYTGSVITEKYVYAVSNPQTFYTSTDYHLTCWDLNTGEQKWQYFINPTSDYCRGFTSPLYYKEKNLIIVGGDRVWGLNADDGSEVWEYGDEYIFVNCSPKLYNGLIYISGSTRMHCINPDTGECLWATEAGITAGEATCAVADDHIYVGGLSKHYYCLDIVDGSVVWDVMYDAETSHWDAPLIVGDRLYYASYYQNLLCLDKTNGDLIWKYTHTGSSAWVTACTYWIDPADSRTVVYTGGAFGDGGVHAIKDMGDQPQLFWESPDFYADASPTLCNGVVYCGDVYSLAVHGFDCATGAEVFTQAVDSDVRAETAFAFGRMIVMARSGIYCFD